MKRKSHIQLGGLLAEQYLSNRARLAKQVYLFGCIEPDWNPATYLKGSRRYEKLRGHNFLNAKRCIRRLAERLERKASISVFGLYRLGKLTHYILDSFTYPHNEHFSGSLTDHLEYEAELQTYFLHFLDQKAHSKMFFRASDTIFQLIGWAHEQYCKLPPCRQTDARYAYAVANAAVSRLLEGIPTALPALESVG